MSSIQTSAEPTPAAAGSSVLAGIGWMLLTTLLFACVTAIVRHVGSQVAATEAAFLRYGFGMLLMLPWLKPLLTNPPAPRLMGLFLFRGLVHGIGVILWFYAMARLPLAEVTALGYLAPLFVTVGAAVFFGERLHTRRIVALLAGLLGALVILRPGLSAISSGQLAQLAAAPLFASSYLIAKRLSTGGDPAVIVAMLSVVCTLVLLPGAVLHWTAPSFVDLCWFALTALFATAGHYTMTQALKAAPLTVTQPVNFLQLVWAAALGIILFGEAVDPFVVLGGGIVVGAATFIAHREAQAARRGITPPAVATKT